MRMIRSLIDLPPITVPDAYRVRPYHVGDEEGWVRLINAAFSTERRTFEPLVRESFEREFPISKGEDRAWILFAERIEDGALAGTTAAWEAEFEGRRMGLVHWVAVDPAHRGRRLGEALLAAALHAMRARGHTEAFLNTDLALEAAVKLYKRLGFVPVADASRSGAGATESEHG
jgi:ribosomal protein S18 acetylase RimI-like enzyme